YTRLKRGLPQRGMGIFFAALISAVIFGALHGTLLQLFYTVPMGLLLCFVYDRYKSLWASVLVHMAFNLCSFIMSYYVIDTVYMFGVFACIGIYLTVFGFVSGESYHRNEIRHRSSCVVYHY
ncbi:MAG: lysostaphin resistance A-like protein, partial [Eubacteriales bacterium]